MATQKQTELLDDLLKHIRDNALDLIDRDRLTLDQLVSAMSVTALKYAQQGHVQQLVDLGALALAHRIKLSKFDI